MLQAMQKPGMKLMLTIKLPDDVRFIIDRLSKAGFDAYAAGGCVRDSLLGKEPSDWDVATEAEPQSVIDVFSGFKAILTGLKHGTVTIIMNRKKYEVTTYRIECGYSDCRRPDAVIFTKVLQSDLKRRDFTINAMAYNDKTGLVDIFGGQDDLRRKVIRCVGDASDRFGEDALRMMRAVRFAAELDFAIEPSVLKIITEKSSLLNKISMERITEEFNKILLSDKPENIGILEESGLLKNFVPEFGRCMETGQESEYHAFNVGEHTIKAVSCVRKDLLLRIALFLHDIGKPECRTTDDDGSGHFHGHAAVSEDMAATIMKRMRYGRKITGEVCTLIRYHDIRLKNDSAIIRKRLAEIGASAFFNLLEVREADIKAQNPEYTEERLERLKKVSETARQIIEEQQCISIDQLAVNGGDLAEAGLPSGPVMGGILKELFDAVLEKPEINRREILLEMAAELYKSGKTN